MNYCNASYQQGVQISVQKHLCWWTFTHTAVALLHDVFVSFISVHASKTHVTLTMFVCMCWLLKLAGAVCVKTQLSSLKHPNWCLKAMDCSSLLWFLLHFSSVKYFMFGLLPHWSEHLLSSLRRIGLTSARWLYANKDEKHTKPQSNVLAGQYCVYLFTIKFQPQICHLFLQVSFSR